MIVAAFVISGLSILLSAYPFYVNRAWAHRWHDRYNPRCQTCTARDAITDAWWPKP